MTWGECGAIVGGAQGTQCSGRVDSVNASGNMRRRSISRNADGVKTLTARRTCVTRAANRGEQDPPDVLLRQEATAPVRARDESRAFGARAARQLWLRQSADLSRLDGALPDRREVVEPRPGIHLRPLFDADRQGAGAGHRRGGGRRRDGFDGVRLPGGQHGHPRLRQVGRPYPHGRQRLSADAQILRLHAVEARRRDDVLRSADRRRHRRARTPQHTPDLHRKPRLANVRGAGHPGDCARRRRPRLVAGDGQHVGEPAVLPPLRPRRRRVHSGGDEIHRRPCRRDARLHHLQCARRQARGRRQGAARRLPRLGGDVSRHARPAHLVDAPCPASARRPRDRALARRAPRGFARAASRPAEPSAARPVEARFPRRQLASSPSFSSRRARPPLPPCSTV